MRTLVFALCATLVAAYSEAQDSRSVTIGERASLRSVTLGEDREYWVYLPPSYRDSTYAPERYPVLYLLDGNVYFHAATGAAEIMSSGATGTVQIPEMIVVAILNTDRTRDFTPTHTTRRPQGEDPSLKSSGGGDAFLKFLETELLPHIDRTYRTRPYRVIVGHSFGGLFALHAFVSAPHVFQGYVAIDPSLFWDDQVLVRRAGAVPFSVQDHPRTVYVALSRSYSGGFAGEAAAKFADEIQKRPAVRSTVQYFENEIHQSVGLVAMYDGLMFLFDGFRLTPGQMFDHPTGLTSHFQQVSERLGVQLRPPERFVDRVAHAFLRANQVDQALELFKFNVAARPASFNAHSSLAQAYAAKGETRLAIEHYETSLRLNSDNDDVRKRLRGLLPDERKR